MKRTSIAPGLRFRILARDEFTCRYCGRSAPSVELAVDHVHPVARGGTDDESNLVAACVECNAGKSALDLTAPILERPSPNQAAAIIGREGGRKGGPARAAKLSPERRKEIAKRAANKRWGNRGDEFTPMESN
jgi:hypothetical protein